MILSKKFIHWLTRELLPKKTHWEGLAVYEFGWNYDDNRGISTTAPTALTIESMLEPIPSWLMSIFFCAANFSSDTMDGQLPDHAMINVYTPGGGISNHFDHPGYWGDWVVGLTLGSGAMMNFLKGGESVEQYLPARTTYLFEGPARNEWTHGIPSRLTDTVDGIEIPRTTRIAITFRKLSKEVLPDELREEAEMQRIGVFS